MAQLGQLGGAEPAPSLLGAPPDRPWPLRPYLRIYVFGGLRKKKVSEGESATST